MPNDDSYLKGYKTADHKLRWLLKDADNSLLALKRGITSGDGLLWRDGKIIELPEADSVAYAFQFHCAEALVRALDKWKGEGMDDQEFLDYVVTHSQTERALFSMAQIERLHTLAGRPIEAGLYTTENIGGNDFTSLHHSLAEALVRAATIRDHA